MESDWRKLCEGARQANSVANFSYAETLWIAALQEAEEFAESDERLIQTLEGLAEAYKKQGKFRQAEKPARQLLETYRQLHSNDHLKTAMAAHNLAIIYHMQQKYGQAEPLYKHALTVKTKFQRAGAPDLLQLLLSYADLLQKTHREAEAENLIKCAQGAAGKELPLKNPSTESNPTLSWSHNSQTNQKTPMAHPPLHEAQTVSSQKDKATSQTDERQMSSPSPLDTTMPADKNLSWKELQEKAEQALARGHVDVALNILNQAVIVAEQAPGQAGNLTNSLDRIGEILYEIEKYGQAEMAWWRSLQIKLGALGSFHPAIAHSANNLAKLHYLLGRYSEAESYTKKCIKIYQRCYGSEHTSIATCMHNLASLYHVQGRYPEAEEQYKSCLRMRKKLLGMGNPETMSISKSYADLLTTLGRDAEAKELNSLANGLVSGSWKAIVVPKNQELSNTEESCLFCGANLAGAKTCPVCGTGRGTAI